MDSERFDGVGEVTLKSDSVSGRGEEDLLDPAMLRRELGLLP